MPMWLFKMIMPVVARLYVWSINRDDRTARLIRRIWRAL